MPRPCRAVMFAASALALLAAGCSRPSPDAAAGDRPGVAAGGFRLTSAAIELPADATDFPDGPGADLVRRRCTACHSAAMALTQPALSAEQWTKTVEKMRDVYHAPVAPDEVVPIVAYLTRLRPPPAARTAG